MLIFIYVHDTSFSLITVIYTVQYIEECITEVAHEALFVRERKIDTLHLKYNRRFFLMNANFQFYRCQEALEDRENRQIIRLRSFRSFLIFKAAS